MTIRLRLAPDKRLVATAGAARQRNRRHQSVDLASSYVKLSTNGVGRSGTYSVANCCRSRS